MRIRTLRLIAGCLAFVLTSSLATDGVEACSCARASCSQAAEYDAVFEATVETVEPPAEGPAGLWSSTDRITVRLRDVRPIRGEADTQVVTARSGASCGYPFRAGTRYLIFASRADGGRLHVGSCGLTRPSDHASGMVRYLESLSAPSAGGRVWGRVVMPSTSRPAAPMVSMRVAISGPREMETITGAIGEFEFVELPPGSYSVSVIAADRPELSFPTHEVRLDEAYACGELLFWPRIHSRVEGRIVDQAGAPIVGVEVTLGSANETSRGLQVTSRVATDDQGRYDFDGLPEGLYTARVRAEPDRNGLAPLTSDPIETQLTRHAALTLGGHVVLEPIRLQRFMRITLAGRVIDTSGAGLGGVPLWVVALDDRSQWSRRFVTDQEGWFSIPAYSGRRQQIIVGSRLRPSADVTIVAGGEPAVITVSRP